ncbi:MAG: OmpH family outer membrane protein [Pseudomonadota bacterium]
MKNTMILCAMLGSLSAVAYAADAAAPAPKAAAPVVKADVKKAAKHAETLGVVDVNRLITESKWAGKLQDSIAADFKAQRDSLTKNEDTFRTKATAYERDSDVLSESDRLDQEKSLVELQEKLKKEQYVFAEALNKRRERDMEQFMNVVTERVEVIAKERNLNLVLPAELVLYVTPGAEITDDVLKGVDAGHAS